MGKPIIIYKYLAHTPVADPGGGGLGKKTCKNTLILPFFGDGPPPPTPCAQGGGGGAIFQIFEDQKNNCAHYWEKKTCKNTLILPFFGDGPPPPPLALKGGGGCNFSRTKKIIVLTYPPPPPPPWCADI